MASSWPSQLRTAFRVFSRDRLFSQSAAKAMRVHSHLSLVVVTLAQLRAPAFLEAFQQAWLASPIQPIPGQGDPVAKLGCADFEHPHNPPRE
jgi:hypothetical protein